MKHIAPVRQALGVRTVFNILGPLANPAAPPFHVIGAFSDAMAALMAETLAGMPMTRAFVVHGEAGWDEATPAGPFVCYDVRPGRVERAHARPARLRPRALRARRLARHRRRQQRRARCAKRSRAATRAAHRDALVLGAALALEVAGARARRTRAPWRAHAPRSTSGAGGELLASASPRSRKERAR